LALAGASPAEMKMTVRRSLSQNLLDTPNPASYTAARKKETLLKDRPKRICSRRRRYPPAAWL